MMDEAMTEPDADETTIPAHQRMTPSNAPNHRQEMKPLPLRVASRQYERLCQARDRTGISIQEHIRRSIDIYLAAIEREAIELGLMPTVAEDGSIRQPRILKR